MSTRPRALRTRPLVLFGLSAAAAATVWFVAGNAPEPSQATASEVYDVVPSTQRTPASGVGEHDGQSSQGSSRARNEWFSIGGGSWYDDITITDGYGQTYDPLTTMVIGGNSWYDDITITDGYGQTYDPLTTMVIGGPLAEGSLTSSLLDLYAMAPPGSLEQAQILGIINSQNNMVNTWVTDTSSDRDGDGTPDYRDPYP